MTPTTTPDQATVTFEAPSLAPLPVTHRPRFGGYAAKTCPEGLAKDYMPNTFPAELKEPFSAFTLGLMESGVEFEDHCQDLLQAALDAGSPGIVIIVEHGRTEDGQRTEEGKLRKEQDTWDAYRDPQTRLIFNARLGGRFSELLSEYLGTPVDDPDRVSEPDAIELGDYMPNGLRAMRFVDVKWHQTTSGKTQPKSFLISPIDRPFFDWALEEERTGSLHADDWIQLAHYYRHGQTLGVVDGDSSYWAAVIGKDERLTWARLDEAHFLRDDPVTGRRRKQTPLEIYDRDFANARAVVDNAIARDSDSSIPALSHPEWKGDCKECPWRTVCLEELTEHGDGGHITLLPGITPPRAVPYYKAGVDDIGSLARLNPNGELSGVNDLKTPVYQARVQMAQQVHRAPDVWSVDMDRAAIEVDFDYEADTNDGVYMRGVTTTHRRTSRNGGLRQKSENVMFDDYTGTPDGELRVFVEFWEYIQKMLQLARTRRKSIRFYHYSHYERTQDIALAKKYVGQPGVPTLGEVMAFYESDKVIDLYAVLPRDLVWPTKSHSIKELARWVGFSWRGAQVGGDLSMVWYKNACTDPDPAVRRANMEILREYNEDDTHAQLALKDWISAHGGSDTPGDLLPSVETLAAPAEPVPAPAAA